MVDPISSNPEETNAVALAAFALSVNTLRFLNKAGVLDQESMSVMGSPL